MFPGMGGRRGGGVGRVGDLRGEVGGRVGGRAGGSLRGGAP